MKNRVYISNQLIVFSHWCRKGYASFASLGKEIRIAVLALHICACALKKSGLKGIIITSARCTQEIEAVDKTKKQWCYHLISTLKEEVCSDDFSLTWKPVKKRIHRLAKLRMYPLFIYELNIL